MHKDNKKWKEKGVSFLSDGFIHSSTIFLHPWPVLLLPAFLLPSSLSVDTLDSQDTHNRTIRNTHMHAPFALVRPEQISNQCHVGLWFRYANRNQPSLIKEDELWLGVQIYRFFWTSFAHLRVLHAVFFHWAVVEVRSSLYALSAWTHKHTHIFIYVKDKRRACQASCGCWLCVDLAAALEKEGTRWQTAVCLSVPSSSYNAAHTAAKYIKTQHLNFTTAILWSENCWSPCLHCTQFSSSVPFFSWPDRCLWVQVNSWHNELGLKTMFLMCF